MVNASNSLCLLVTGAGAPGLPGTVYSLRNNFDNRPVRLVGIDTNPNVGGRFLMDRFYTVPPPEDPGYVDVLCDICRHESVRIVLPQTTREIVRLSQCRKPFEEQGIGMMVSPATAIAMANSKYLVLKKFQQLCLPCPKFRLATTESDLLQHAQEFGYPDRRVVIKPPVSNGMRGVRILTSEPWDVPRFLTEKPSGLEISLEELLRMLRKGPAWPELMVMEYLSGPEYTVDAYLGASTSIAVPRLRQSVRSGITFTSKTELRQDLSEFTLQAARSIGLRFAFGFQFKLDEQGIPKVLECNPRIQGTMVASTFSGANVVWFGVKELLQEKIPSVPPAIKVSEFYRIWGGFGVAGDVVDAI